MHPPARAKLPRPCSTHHEIVCAPYFCTCCSCHLACVSYPLFSTWWASMNPLQRRLCLIFIHAIIQQVCTDVPDPRHRWTKNRLIPFSSWNYCHTCVKHPISKSLPLLCSHRCVCVCAYICICMIVCVYMYVYTHTFYSTDYIGIWWFVGEFFSSVKLNSLHLGIIPH